MSDSKRIEILVERILAENDIIFNIKRVIQSRIRDARRKKRNLSGKDITTIIDSTIDILLDDDYIHEALAPSDKDERQIQSANSSEVDEIAVAEEYYDDFAGDECNDSKDTDEFILPNFSTSEPIDMRNNHPNDRNGIDIDEINENYQTKMNGSINASLPDHHQDMNTNQIEIENNKSIIKNKKHVQFVADDILNEVYTFGRYDRFEILDVFYSHHDMDLFINEYNIEESHAKSQGMEWIEWVYQRTDEDIKHDEILARQKLEQAYLKSNFEFEIEDESVFDEDNYEFDDGDFEDNDENRKS
jgi:hypothetical protein